MEPAWLQGSYEQALITQNKLKYRPLNPKSSKPNYSQKIGVYDKTYADFRLHLALNSSPDSLKPWTSLRLASE